MSLCPRCRAAAAPGDAWCGQCGLHLPSRTSTFPTAYAAPAGLPANLSAAVVLPPRQPGAVTAARVLIVLGVIGDSAWALGGFAFAFVGSRFGEAISRSGDDDGTGATISTLSRWLVLFSVLLLVSALVGVWAFRGVGAGRRSVRSVLTTLHVLDLLGAVALAAAFGLDAVGVLVVALPAKALLLVLLWVPESSRHWFANPPSGAAGLTGLDAPTVRLSLARGASRSALPAGLLAVGLIVVLGIAVVALVPRASSGSTTSLTAADVGPRLQSCARTFEQEWGPGLASPAGEEITVAAVGFAIANGSFDTPTDTPRHVLEQAYQTQDSAGNLLTTVSDRHITDALADPRFTSCSQDAASLRGNTAGTLAVFGCRPKSGPFRMDC